MKHHIPVEFGKIYHIYNRGNNSENLFLTPENYTHFLSLYNKYIDLVAETYAWCLMPNHFHLLVRIKDETEVGLLKPKRGQKTPPKKAVPENQFGHLFNAYTEAFNTQNHRRGSLFEHPFKRIEVASEEYLKQLVYYIHSNPVKHSFTESMLDWSWSSYLSIVSGTPTKTSRDTVLAWFKGQSEFAKFHGEGQDLELIKFALLEE